MWNISDKDYIELQFKKQEFNRKRERESKREEKEICSDELMSVLKRILCDRSSFGINRRSATIILNKAALRFLLPEHSRQKKIHASVRPSFDGVSVI